MKKLLILIFAISLCLSLFLSYKDFFGLNRQALRAELPPICKNRCAEIGRQRCANTKNFQICGNYDSDDCLEWSSNQPCPTSSCSGTTYIRYSCSGAGICVSKNITNYKICLSCGNKKCESPSETIISCPSDCDTNPPTNQIISNSISTPNFADLPDLGKITIDGINNTADLFVAPILNNLSLGMQPKGNFPITINPRPIYSVSVSGTWNINSSNGYVRIILVDKEGKQYLVYEAIGPIDYGRLEFNNACMETCSLNGIIPDKLISETSDGSIDVSNLTIVDNLQNLNVNASKGPSSYQKDLNYWQYKTKLARIQKFIKNNNLQWTAGETNISKLSFDQRRRILGFSGSSPMANTQGLEFYKGGVFTPLSEKGTPKNMSFSMLPRSFDWRNRHGQNWLTSVKQQGDCGSCWAFAHAGTIELAANLYYNQNLNLDLSEQELISCYYNGSCDGLLASEIEESFQYISNNGLVAESCFPYKANSLSCSLKCKKANLSAVIPNNGAIRINPGDEEIKRILITKGPIDSSSVFSIPGHAMVMVGYDTDPSNYTIWIFKNSWGSDWGEGGYLRSTALSGYYIVPDLFYISQPVMISGLNAQIMCNDNDQDGYCNWGISEEKPLNCPANCKPEKDCDDSNKNLGPYDSYFNCLNIGYNDEINLDTISPVVSKPFPSVPVNIFYKAGSYEFSARISDNEGVSGCQLFLDNFTKPEAEMILTTPYCKDCIAKGSAILYQTGTQSFYVKCWDVVGNIKNSEPLVINVETTKDPVVEAVKPVSGKTNKEITFSAKAFSERTINACTLNIDGYYDGYKQMVLSRPTIFSNNPGSNLSDSVTATQKHTFTKAGKYSVYVSCEDSNWNTGEGTPINVIITDETSSNIIVKVEDIALNEEVRISANILSEEKISACILKINGKQINNGYSDGYMYLSPKAPCTSCTASMNYTFTSPGTYSVVVKCSGIDNNKNLFSIESNPAILNLKCPICSGPLNTCEKPSVCDKSCGADQSCSGKNQYSFWETKNICHTCNGACRYQTYSKDSLINNFSNNSSNINNCYYDCAPSCTSRGWSISQFNSSNCKVDSSKACSTSICTRNGWDNNSCGTYQISSWKPCGNTEINSCKNTSSCGYSGKSKTTYCSQNETIESGKCIPLSNSKVVNSYKSENGWYCRFACKTLLCFNPVGGCTFVQCKRSF